mgnify:CR=1 FL=1
MEPKYRRHHINTYKVEQKLNWTTPCTKQPKWSVPGYRTNHDPYIRCNNKDTASLFEECHFNFIKLIIDHEFPETLHNHLHIYIYISMYPNMWNNYERKRRNRYYIYNVSPKGHVQFTALRIKQKEWKGCISRINQKTKHLERDQTFIGSIIGSFVRYISTCEGLKVENQTLLGGYATGGAG